ncbi:hypothetical protein [Nocardia sp. CC201C]|uniref:hypothetical protein n=1 Tax=Nocardia sp. CC201C TaxID=3044575 RepID=UPI0024A91347|nr:hypothetical protein [Nocardia sp. CC201C]
MGLFVLGAPVHRIYLGDQRIRRVYLGGTLVWADVEGMVLAPAATGTAVLPVPVLGGELAAVAGEASAQAPIPAFGAALPVPPGETTAVLPVPALSLAVGAPSAAAVAAMPEAEPVFVESISAPSALASAVLPGPLLDLAVLAPYADATAIMPTPVPTTALLIQTPPALADAQLPAPAVVLLVAPSAAAAGADTIAPVLALAAPVPSGTATAAMAATVSSVVPAVAATAASATPVPGVGMAVVAPAAAATATMPAPTTPTFAPSRMNKNGTHSITATSPTFQAVQNWVADTTAAPGSTVSSHALVTQGGKPAALIEVQYSIANSSAGSVSATIQIRVNGAIVKTGSATPCAGFQTTTVQLSHTMDLANGALVSVEVTSNFSGSLTIQSGSATYVRIT